MAIERITVDPDGTFDELFAANETIHIERMDDDHVWMRVGDTMLSVWVHEEPWWRFWRRGRQLDVIVQPDPPSWPRGLTLAQ